MDHCDTFKNCLQILAKHSSDKQSRPELIVDKVKSNVRVVVMACDPVRRRVHSEECITPVSEFSIFSVAIAKQLSYKTGMTVAAGRALPLKPSAAPPTRAARQRQCTRAPPQVTCGGYARLSVVPSVLKPMNLRGSLPLLNPHSNVLVDFTGAEVSEAQYSGVHGPEPIVEHEGLGTGIAAWRFVPPVPVQVMYISLRFFPCHLEILWLSSSGQWQRRDMARDCAALQVMKLGINLPKNQQMSPKKVTHHLPSRAPLAGPILGHITNDYAGTARLTGTGCGSLENRALPVRRSLRSSSGRQKVLWESLNPSPPAPGRSGK
jgi:hypothetical protein